MPLTRDQVDINGTVLDCEPFNWPRNNWEVLEIRITERRGWASLATAAKNTLQTLFNGAHGSVVDGLFGLIVQYVEATGSAPFVITDWRGNTGNFVFVPDDGFDVEEIFGAAEADPSAAGGYWSGTLKFAKV